MPNKKRVRIFAGPNGAGKSTLKTLIEGLFNIGVYVNADDILSTLRNSFRLEFSDYRIQVKEEAIRDCYRSWPLKTDPNSWIFENNGVTMRNNAVAEDYFASFLADFIRHKLLETADRFSFETVMSHSSKLDFIKDAKRRGFKVYLYFVTLPDPDLNVLRVQSRVREGGHNVDETKIRDRYVRTMNHLLEAIRLSDNAYLFDNSASKPLLVARKENGELITEGTLIPSWYQQYVLEKLRK